MKFEILTFNVSKSTDLFSDVLEYVGGRDNVIAGLQEVKRTDGLFKNSTRYLKDRCHIFPNISKQAQMIFVVSSNINCRVAAHSINSRFMSITLPSANGDVEIVNIHGNCVKATDCRQTQLLALFIKIKEALFNNERRIILGDLNCNPFDSYIATGDTFHSRKDTEDLRITSMFNPTWDLLVNSTPNKGSIYWDEPENITSYQQFDQILISKKLSSSFLKIEIPSSVGRIDQTSASSLRRGVHDRTTHHKAVRMEIDL